MHQTIIHHIALSRTLYPHPHSDRSPPYPTDFSGPLMMEPPDLTSPSQHHHNLIYTLYYLFLAHCLPPDSRHRSHPLSSLSSVRCIISSTPSQTSAMPHLKCFMSLFGFWSSGLPLAVHCVCYWALFVIAIETFSFRCHPIRDQWLAVCIIVSSLFFFVPLNCVFRVGFSEVA